MRKTSESKFLLVYRNLNLSNFIIVKSMLKELSIKGIHSPLKNDVFLLPKEIFLISTL